MGIRERYEYVVDVITDKASTSLKSFSSSISEAEGTTGKLRAGVAHVGGVLRENMVPAMIGAGAAVGTFVANAVSDFTEAGLAVGRFSDSTGLSLDQSSRWADVASDVGVSTEAMQSGFVRLEKAIAGNSAATRELGIETVYAADGTADMSATMLDAIRRLNEIQDPQEKAALAAQLFGRNFAEMAEIVMGNADQIKGALDDVAGAQIFNEDKLEKIKRMRERMDQFSDSWTGLKYRAADATLTVTDGVERFYGAYYDMGQDLRGLFDSGAAYNRQSVESWDAATEAASGFDQTIIANAKSYDEIRAAANAYTDDITAQNIIIAAWSRHQKELAADLPDLTDKTANQGMAAGDTAAAEKILADRYAEERKQIEKLTDQYNDHKKRVNDLIDAKLELVGGERAVREAQRDARTAASELNDVLKDGNTTLDQAAAAIDDATDSQVAAADAAAQYRLDQMEANGTTVDAKVKAQVYKEELQKLADQTTGPLHDALMGLINDINSIQDKTVNITVLANGRRVNVGDGLAIGGGIISDGPDTGGRGQTLRSPGSGQVSGGVTVNVNAGAVIRQDDLGKTVAAALTQAQRAGVRMPWS